jgi:hypothetical protein
MHTKLYHIRFDTTADAYAAAKQLASVKGALVVGVSEAHSHGPDILVLRLDDGVTVEELAHEAPALELSQDWQAFDMEASETEEEDVGQHDGGDHMDGEELYPAPSAGRVVPVMTPEDDSNESHD